MAVTFHQICLIFYIKRKSQESDLLKGMGLYTDLIVMGKAHGHFVKSLYLSEFESNDFDFHFSNGFTPFVKIPSGCTTIVFSLFKFPMPVFFFFLFRF